MDVAMSMDVFLIAQINLVVQVAILVSLFAGLILKKRNKFFLHGTAMLVAVVLNAISFFLVMGPSLLSLGQTVEEHALNRLSLAVLGHASFGSAAEVLGIWLVGSWRLRSSVQGCVRKKRIMLVTIVLWLIAILFGILLFTLLYTTMI
jgi:uncharacterized membrane protein YozB (DUF420 family)